MTIGEAFPTYSGKTTQPTRIIFEVKTPISGASEATISVGSTVLVDMTDVDILTTNTYVVDGIAATSIAGSQLVLKFFAADGTTLSTPTAGELIITVEYKVF